MPRVVQRHGDACCAKALYDPSCIVCDFQDFDAADAPLLIWSVVSVVVPCWVVVNGCFLARQGSRAMTKKYLS